MHLSLFLLLPTNHLVATHMMLACFQGVCLVLCSGCHLVTLTTQGQAAIVSDVNEALQQWGAIQQPLQPAPQSFQHQYQQQLRQQP